LSIKERLVILSGSFPDIACGVSRHVGLIAERIAERGAYDVHVLTSDDRAVNKDIAKGYQVHPLIKKWGLGQAGTICRKIIAIEPAVVHIQNPTIKYRRWRSLTMSAVAPKLKRLLPQVRLVVTQHDIAVGRPLFRWRYYPLLRAADAITVSNRRDYQAVRAQGISPAKVYRAPVSSHFWIQAAGPQKKKAAREKFDIPQDALCVSYFGFVHPERNVDVIIRALHLLAKENHRIHGLVMGGPFPENRAYYDQCRRLAKELGLGDRITWTGFAREDQIIDGFAASDIFVTLPQRGADMRNTSLISAMLAELPVVAARNEHYYVDTDLEQLGCTCVPPKDAKAVAQAIAELAAKPPSADLLAQRAALLEPGKIWARHVEVLCRAYRNEVPLEISLSPEQM